MKGNNLVLGAVIVVVLLLAGYFLWNSVANPNAGNTATTTPTSASGGGSTPNPEPTSSGDAPSVQTDARAVPSNSTAVVTGRVTPNGAPTSYWYEYGESAALGNNTASQGIGSGFVSIPATGYITGLRANTLYYFRLSAKNAFGTASGATYTFNTNSNPPPQGTVPSASTDAATGIARTTATLNAQVNPKGSSTSYWFEYGETTDLGRATGFQSAGSGNTPIAVSAPIAGLNADTKYYFRVNAQNQFGTVQGPLQSFTTKGPPSPGTPSVDTTSATNVASSTATLNARISPNGAETTYWFEYSNDSLLGHLITTSTGSQSLSADASTLSVSMDISGLSSNTRYFYRVVARNQFGTVRGDTVSFRTRPQ